jgi:hypothetical protein
VQEKKKRRSQIYVAHLGVEEKWAREPEGRRPLGSRKSRWEDDMKMDLKRTGWEGEGVDWIHLPEDRNNRRAVVKMVMNLLGP